MKLPRIRPRRALASLTTLLAALQLSPVAHAQAETEAQAPAEPAAAEAADSEASTSESKAGARTEATGELNATLGGGAEESAEGGADADADADANANANAEPQEPSSAAKDTSDAPEPEPAIEEQSAYGVDLMRLPGSAYPEPLPRGIPGGSLWFTMHGLQWPYMPMRGAEPGLMIGVSGYAWVDPSYAKESTTEPNNPDESRWRAQGRLVARLTPTYSQDDWFVQAQGELVANSDQETTRTQAPDTDDLWVRAGKWNLFDVQLGRFEGWEIYHFGMGLDLNTFERNGVVIPPIAGPRIYGVTYGYYRDSIGNVAAHLYPLDILRIELMGKFGSTGFENVIGGRPVAILDMGFVKVKVGGEYFKGTQVKEDNPRESERRGVGAAVQGVFEPWLEAGINGAIGLVDVIDSNEILLLPDSHTTYSYGGFVNVRVIDRLIVGGGANLTWLENLQEDANGNVGEFDHLQTFGAVQYALFNQLYLKFVGAYARGRFAPTFTQTPPWESTLLSARFRASLYF